MVLRIVPGPLDPLGICVFDDVLSPSRLEGLLVALRATDGEPAAVYRVRPRSDPSTTSAALTVEDTSRRTKRLNVSDDVTSEIHDFFESMGPNLSAHLGLELCCPTSPSFLRYAPGDFFLPHRDGAGEYGDAEIRHRNLSAVLFLNGPDDDPPFAGGELVLLPFEDLGSESGLVIAARAGRLVVFPPTLVHEVKTVTTGERYTVVTWFHEPAYSDVE
jgi:predicted 2-oxoglutarate/Fe(II)-dependent dioxygenase YbiX